MKIQIMLEPVYPHGVMLNNVEMRYASGFERHPNMAAVHRVDGKCFLIPELEWMSAYYHHQRVITEGVEVDKEGNIL